MMDAPKKKLDFAKPPVDEVVLSVLFKPLNGFLAPHLGALWQEFKKDQFARIVERPLVNPTIEIFPNQGEETEFEISNVPPFPRTWFIHEGESKILQVQRDRFTFNWRRTDSDQKYPGFSAIFESFEGFYNRFGEIMKNLELGSVTPLQYELSYIDQLMHGDGWNVLNDIGKVYNMFVDSQHANSFWKGAELMIFQTSFSVPDLRGRLHLAISNRVKMPDQRQTLQTDFTVRGFPENAAYPMEMWFKEARDEIREKFISMFTEDIQTQIWERRQ